MDIVDSLLTLLTRTLVHSFVFLGALFVAHKLNPYKQGNWFREYKWIYILLLTAVVLSIVPFPNGIKALIALVMITPSFYAFSRVIVAYYSYYYKEPHTFRSLLKKWSDDRQAKQKSKANKIKATSFNYDENFHFTSGKKHIVVDNPYRGVMVIGGAGSGKSRTFIYPFIKQASLQEFTGVIYDFKSPELGNLAQGLYQKNAKRVEVQRIDFNDTKHSLRVNPLHYVDSPITAINYANAFIFNLMPQYIKKPDFWFDSISSLFSASIWYFVKNHYRIATLPHIFTFFVEYNAEQIVKILSTDKEVKGMITALRQAVEQGAGNQVAGVLGTFQNAIGRFNNAEMFYLLSKNEVNLDVNNPEKPTMLVIGTDSTKADTYAPVIGLLMTISSKLMNQKDKEKSMILIDESPTLYLPNFETIPATARSNKVAVILGAQDISQMVDKYGREKAEVMLSNLGNQFYGRTTNNATAEKVVKMFGQREDIITLKSRSGKGIIGRQLKPQAGKSQSIQKRDRVKMQEMFNLEVGQFVGLIAQGTPKEFNLPIDLQDMELQGEIKRKANDITESRNKVFDKIQNDILRFKEVYNNAVEKEEAQKKEANLKQLDEDINLLFD